MPTYTKEKLSGSTDGRGVKVAATSSPGTTIHTADASAKDEIYLYAFNSDSSQLWLVIQFGGTTSPDDSIKIFIPSETGLLLVVPGLILTNSAVVRAFAESANKIMVHGFVNRIS